MGACFKRNARDLLKTARDSFGAVPLLANVLQDGLLETRPAKFLCRPVGAAAYGSLALLHGALLAREDLFPSSLRPELGRNAHQNSLTICRERAPFSAQFT